jgi:hypothetical protein
MMHTYQAKVRINGGCVPVSIDARTSSEARMLLEAQYGPGSVVSTPTR